MDAGVTFYEPENQLIFLIIKESLTLHMLNNMNKPIESNKIEPVIDEFANATITKQNITTSTKLELRELNKEFEDI
jgi:hypothetical protein